MRTLFFALLILNLVISAAPAGAQSKALWDTCRRDNSLDRRITACTKIIALDRLSDKHRASAYFNRCVAYWKKKKFDPVVADCTEAIKLNSRRPNYHKYRGMAYRRTGQLDRAIADYDTAIKLDPKFHDGKLYFNRGVAYWHKGRMNLAIADFTEAIRLNPKDHFAFDWRATVYLKKVQYDRAMADINTAIRLKPEISGFFNRRGAVYLHKGDKERARADFQKALALDPSSTDAKTGLKRVGTGPASPPAATSNTSQSVTAEELGKLPDIEGLEKLR